MQSSVLIARAVLLFSSASYQCCTFDTLPTHGQPAEAYLWHSASCEFEMNVCEPHELMLNMLHLQIGYLFSVLAAGGI
jgi:hypothetical protein